MSNTALDALRVPISPPANDEDRSDIGNCAAGIKEALDREGDKTATTDALFALADDLTALAIGGTSEMAAHYRKGLGVWGFAESSTEMLHEATMALLHRTTCRRDDAPRNVEELREAHTRWKAECEGWEAWLDRAEELLDREENR